jgi:hypothetical protein
MMRRGKSFRIAGDSHERRLQNVFGIVLIAG